MPLSRGREIGCEVSASHISKLIDLVHILTSRSSVRYNLPNNRIYCVRSHQEWLRENGPKTPGNPPASARGRVQTPAEKRFREMRGMDIARAGLSGLCCHASLPPSPSQLEGAILLWSRFLAWMRRIRGESAEQRRLQRAVAAENSASSLPTRHAPPSSAPNRRYTPTCRSRVRRVKRRYLLRDYRARANAHRRMWL